MKVAVFGDSVAAGLGVRGRSFAAIVAEELDAELISLATTSQKMPQALELADQAAGADIVLLSQGGADGIVRPSEWTMKFVPRRWRAHGWMDPRPYYSRKRLQRIGQRIESAVRWRLKVFLIKISGGYRICEPPEYEIALREMVNRLIASGCGTVVVMSHTGVDDRYYPGTNKSLEDYDAIERKIAEETGALFVDVRGTSPKWDGYFLDHAHPNEIGHRAFADHLLREIAPERAVAA